MPSLKEPRRGAGLAELVVALGLSALLAAAASTALVGVERYVRRTAADDAARRVLSESEFVLVSEVRGAAADSIAVRGDTAIDLLAGVALSVACVATGRDLVLPSDAAVSGLPFTLLRSAPVVGDMLAAYDTVAGWRTTRIDVVQWRSDGAGCPTTSGFRTPADSAARVRGLRLRLADSIAAAGAPVRIFRRGRYVLARSSDGSWGLAWRRCDPAPASCGSSQPAAGPLSAPADSGLVFRLAPDGSALAIRLAAPVATGASRRRTLTIALRLGDGRR